MRTIRSIVVSPLELNLWEENPRFVAAPSEDTNSAIRQHLLETAKVVELAQMIVDYGGIFPGERAVVTPHEGNYLVLEGNRRICAFQLLLDPTLIADAFKALFPHATKSVLDDIESIEVDIIPSIDEAVSFLAARHITSVEKWPPIAKQRFVANAHKKCPKLSDLAKNIHMNKADIKTDLQDFYPLEYTLNLPDWTPKEKESLDWSILKVDRFQRILRLKGARSTLGISFTQDMAMEISLPVAVFDRAMRLIAEAAFITAKVDTRTSSLFEVPGLQELLEVHKQTSPARDQHAYAQKTPGPNSSATEKPKPLESPEADQPKPPAPVAIHTPQQSNQSIQPIPIANAPMFFEHLTLTITSNDPDGTGVLALAAELKDINYKKCPIASAMLMRAIIEQSMRYCIKKSGEWPRLLSTLRNKKDPGISDLITYVKNNATKVLPDVNAQRNLNALFGAPGLKDYLDLIIHQTDMTKTTWAAIQAIAKSGCVRLIEQLTV